MNNAVLCCAVPKATGIHDGESWVCGRGHGWNMDLIGLKAEITSNLGAGGFASCCDIDLDEVWCEEMSRV